MIHNLPKPLSRYRPRADAGILSREVQTAWEERHQREWPETAVAEAAKVILAHAKLRYPTQDMMILARYGVAQEVDRCIVMVFDSETKYYDQTFGIGLPEKILAPQGRCDFTACASRYSEWPNRGVSESARSQMEIADEWDKFCADQDQHERWLLPRELDGLFKRLCNARKEYQTEWHQSTKWPTAIKQETGEWPTWRQIAEKWPTLGAHLDRKWAMEQ